MNDRTYQQLNEDVRKAAQKFREADDSAKDSALTEYKWLRNVLADFCCDAGRADAGGLHRWLAKEGKLPYYVKDTVYTYFDAGVIAKGLGDPESDLPAGLYKRLLAGKVTANHKSYADLDALEADLLAAWTLALAEGWDPDKEKQKEGQE